LAKNQADNRLPIEGWLIAILLFGMSKKLKVNRLKVYLFIEKSRAFRFFI